MLKFVSRPLVMMLGEKMAGHLRRLIVETAWPFRYRYALALVLMGITAGMFAVVALLMRDVFNEVFIAEDPEALRWIALIVFAVFTVRGLSMYGQSVVLARINNRIVADLQKRLYAHILAQGQRFHEDRSSGEVTVRVVGNASAASAVLQTLALRLGSDLLTVLAMVGVMLWNDATMTFLALFGLPVIVGGVAWLVKRVKTIAREQIFLGAKGLTIATEASMGSRVIRAFNLQGMVLKRASHVIDEMRVRSDRLAMLGAMSNPLMEFIAGIGAAVVLLYAGWQIIGAGMEVGTLVSFLFALLAAGDPARRLAQLAVSLRQSMVGVEVIYEMLDTDERMPEPENAPDLAIESGEIRLQDVSFSYDGEPAEAAALTGLSMAAKGGEVTALVGPSGGGKSTILSLIERFFDPDRGRILIDNQDTRDVSLASLREQVALVTQETFLFDDTVAENIRFGRQNATREEIEEAARLANADAFIAELDQGYDTPLGEGGSALSGGQRQRIAIARAMLRNAPILLLDEATSSLDAESEAHVQDALDTLMQGRTTLVIAHRLATIRRAHSIAVIEGGRVVEQGTHDGLVAKGGLYARLSELQFGKAT
ncbi:MAG: ABC transporter ATP-binding protein [Pseudomonadota bacterium]